MIDSALDVHEFSSARADSASADHARDVRELCHLWLFIETAALQLAIERGASFPPSEWARAQSLHWPQRHTARHLALVAGADNPYVHRVLSEVLRELEDYLGPVEFEDQVELLLVARRAGDANACAALLSRQVAEVEALLIAAAVDARRDRELGAELYFNLTS